MTFEPFLLHAEVFVLCMAFTSTPPFSPPPLYPLPTSAFSSLSFTSIQRDFLPNVSVRNFPPT